MVMLLHEGQCKLGIRRDFVCMEEGIEGLYMEGLSRLAICRCQWLSV
jgi:hypothetical protein